jgi:hypothetical protein
MAKGDSSRVGNTTAPTALQRQSQVAKSKGLSEAAKYVDINATQDLANPMDDPRTRAQVETAQGIAFYLLKAMKQINIYRHAEMKFPEFLEKTWLAIKAYNGEFGPLQFTIELTNFTMFKQEMFTEDNPLSYKLYKDGIRRIIFQPGLTLDELVRLVMIFLSDPDRGAEEINGQLWTAQIKHLEYIMYDGFHMDEFDEEEIQVEVDKIIEYLQARLRSNNEDYLRFARLTEADLEMRLDDIEQMKGLVVQGVTATPDYKAQLQKDITEEQTQRLFPKLVSAVFQVVESGVDDPELLEEMFLQLLDAMLLQEDFGTIGQLVLKLRAMEQRHGADSPIAQMLKKFVAKMGEEQRLMRIAEVLKTTRPKHPQDIARYLAELDISTTGMLLDVLEAIEVPENRTLLIDVLVPFARKQPQPFVERIESDRPQTVRDMVQILDRSNHPDKLKFFADLIKSPNLVMKLEVMSIIAKGRTGEARALIANCLTDEVLQVRLTAARVLPEFDREAAYLDLQRIIKDEATFHKREVMEQEAFYVALGSTNVPGAIAYFQELLHKKTNLFTKGRVLEDKIHAVHGLVGACTIETCKLLTAIVDEAGQPAEVVSAAKVGLVKVKAQLFGEKGSQLHG